MGWGGLLEGSALRPPEKEKEKENPSNLKRVFYYHQELLEHFSCGEVETQDSIHFVLFSFI